MLAIEPSALGIVLGAVLSYLAVLVILQLSFAAISIRALARRERARPQADAAQGISVVIAACNEELTIARLLRAVAAQTKPPRSVIVVDDGSADRTSAVAEATLRELNLLGRVIRIPRTGKGAALAHGLCQVDTSLVCLADADGVIDNRAFEHLHAVVTPDSEIEAATAFVLPLARSARPVDVVLTICQTLEYARAILWRPALAEIGALSIVEGRLGMFRTDTLRKVNILGTTAAVDYALTIGLYRACAQASKRCRIAISTRATVLTEIPRGLGDFVVQRRRWVSGLNRNFVSNLGMLCRSRYGRVGMVELPIRGFVSIFPTVEFVFLTSTGLAIVTGSSYSRLLLWFAAVYFAGVCIQLGLALFCTQRFASISWSARRRAALWLSIPLVALCWEPFKGALWLSILIARPRQVPHWQVSR